MELNIDELKIYLLTNIPNSGKIEFTKNMIFIPDKTGNDQNSKTTKPLNERPYFTSDIEYPSGEILKMDYKKRIEFFFNKETFSKELSIMKTIKGLEIIGDELFEIERMNNKNKKQISELLQHYKEKRENNIRKNILTMLKSLFPSYFPAVNDIGNSFDIVLNGMKKFKDVRYNPITYYMNSLTKYSYLKIDGQVYTITDVTWINDFLNHPNYRSLLEKYVNFNRQRILESFKNENKNNENENENENKNNVFFDKFIRDELVYPYRTSDNEYLQEVLDSLKDRESNDFKNFMDYMYNFYLMNNKNTKQLEDSQKDNFKKFMNVSISNINLNERKTKMKEIYVMLDFIEGIVNDENMNKIKCTFFNQHLGNELDTLLFDYIYKDKDTNTGNWDITKKRTLFSIKDMDSVTNKSILEKEKENQKDKNEKKEPETKIDLDIFITKINEKFKDFIFKIKKDEKNKDLKKKIEEYEKTINELKDLENIKMDENIFKFLNNYKIDKESDEKEIIRINKIKSNNLKKEFFELMQKYYKKSKLRIDESVDPEIKNDYGELENKILYNIKLLENDIDNLKKEEKGKEVKKLTELKKINILFSHLVNIFENSIKIEKKKSYGGKHNKTNKNRKIKNKKTYKNKRLLFF
jgi:hypothetical protein